MQLDDSIFIKQYDFKGASHYKNRVSAVKDNLHHSLLYQVE